ncbi:hypothetical protein EEB11_02050 [Pseudotabrizicola sediminis]|uniref:Toprim domain-containing protein n=1 Tax=Pseudotabrizicola sediminis TaxID=2486418 RepID=A0ABY2KRE4_9RHOB|nr:toprim domain-containing protein [Pseudotabrizicola sediminis]TGD45356.1 hypothetical protein EEB11_02050 [Pseudotabrizicola sediminis]
MTDAETIARGLGGVWRGNRGNAPCPICQPERRKGQDALSLRNEGGRLLAFCHKRGCSFQDMARALDLPPGIFRPDAEAMRASDLQRAKDEAQREGRAKALWGDAETVAITGTLAEAYLRGRGITCPLPDTLRYQARGWHPSAHRFPMMVARVDGGARFAVHRTYLSPNNGKAPIAPNKAMLGACAGGAVQVAQAEGPLVVAEGIETALSLASGLLGKPATIWAALSTSGMRGLVLPPIPGRLTIAADGDQPGREAAMALAARADALGWRVRLLPAPDGRDWNDVLALKGGVA